MAYARNISAFFVLVTAAVYGACAMAQSADQIELSCSISIKNFPAVQDASVDMQGIKLSGGPLSESGRKKLQTIGGFEFWVVSNMTLSVGSESEIISFITEIKQRDTGMVHRAESGVDYLTKRTRAARTQLVLYEDQEFVEKGHMRFECINPVEGPTLVERRKLPSYDTSPSVQDPDTLPQRAPANKARIAVLQ